MNTLKSKINPKTGNYEKIFDIEDIILATGQDYSTVLKRAKELKLNIIFGTGSPSFYSTEAVLLQKTLIEENTEENIDNTQVELVSWEQVTESLKDTVLYKMPQFILRLGLHQLYPSKFPHHGTHYKDKAWKIPTESEVNDLIEWIKKHKPNLILPKLP